MKPSHCFSPPHNRQVGPVLSWFHAYSWGVLWLYSLLSCTILQLCQHWAPTKFLLILMKCSHRFQFPQNKQVGLDLSLLHAFFLHGPIFYQFVEQESQCTHYPLDRSWPITLKFSHVFKHTFKSVHLLQETIRSGLHNNIFLLGMTCWNN